MPFRPQRESTGFHESSCTSPLMKHSLKVSRYQEGLCFPPPRSPSRGCATASTRRPPSTVKTTANAKSLRSPGLTSCVARSVSLLRISSRPSPRLLQSSSVKMSSIARRFICCGFAICNTRAHQAAWMCPREPLTLLSRGLVSCVCMYLKGRLSMCTHREQRVCCLLCRACARVKHSTQRL